MAATLDAATRPQEWKAINYWPRAHPYYRMLADWFDQDADTGREVRQMADADLATLHESGFNAIHLYLWDQATFDDFYEKRASKRREDSGFAYPNPLQSKGRRWQALDEFVSMAERHDLWVIPHFVHTPFNDRIDSMTRAEVVERARAIAGWAGSFIEHLTLRHHNILAWGALYALEPAPDDQPAHPNNYSLLWRKVYVSLKRQIQAANGNSEPPPLFTFLWFPSTGRNILQTDSVRAGPLEGYALDAKAAKIRYASMKRHLSYELGRPAEPDLVYTYLFGPDTEALARSLGDLTTGVDAVPADRLFLAEYGISSPFGASGHPVMAFGENATPTTDLYGQAAWLRQCLCMLQSMGINKTAYWMLYDAPALWASPTWALSRSDVSLNGHFGLAFDDAPRGFKPAWHVLSAFHSGRPVACREPRVAMVDAGRGPVRFVARRQSTAEYPPPAPVAHAAQAIRIRSVVSPASSQATSRNPGALLSIFLSGLQDIPGLWQPRDFPLPLEQFGIKVTFYGYLSEPPRQGALVAVANNQPFQQIIVQIPWELNTVSRLVVSQGDAQFEQMNFGSSKWGEFFKDSTGNGIAIHENGGELVTAANPARPSKAVVFYMTNVRLKPKVVPATGDAIDPAHASWDYTVNLDTTRSRFHIVVDGTDTAAGGAVTHVMLAPQSVGLFYLRLVVPSVKTPQKLTLYYGECGFTVKDPFLPCFSVNTRSNEVTLPVAP